MKECVDVKLVMDTVQQHYIEQQLQLEGLSSIVQMYSSIRNECSYEVYLPSISKSRPRTQLSNFRLGNHKLQIQTARCIKNVAKQTEHSCVEPVAVGMRMSIIIVGLSISCRSLCQVYRCWQQILS